jgi:hypothetical protein
MASVSPLGQCKNRPLLIAIGPSIHQKNVVVSDYLHTMHGFHVYTFKRNIINSCIELFALTNSERRSSNNAISRFGGQTYSQLISKYCDGLKQTFGNTFFLTSAIHEIKASLNAGHDVVVVDMTQYTEVCCLTDTSSDAQFWRVGPSCIQLGQNAEDHKKKFEEWDETFEEEITISELLQQVEIALNKL